MRRLRAINCFARRPRVELNFFFFPLTAGKFLQVPSDVVRTFPVRFVEYCLVLLCPSIFKLKKKEGSHFRRKRAAEDVIDVTAPT